MTHISVIVFSTLLGIASIIDSHKATSDILESSSIMDGDYEIQKVENIGCYGEFPNVLGPCANLGDLVMCWTGFISIRNGVIRYPNLLLEATDPNTGISWSQNLMEVGNVIESRTRSTSVDDLVWRRQNNGNISFEPLNSDKVDCYGLFHFKRK